MSIFLIISPISVDLFIKSFVKNKECIVTMREHNENHEEWLFVFRPLRARRSASVQSRSFAPN